MVKLQKVPQDGGGQSKRRADCLSISGYSAFKGYRQSKRLVRVKVLKMLTPRRPGPISPDEIGKDAKDSSASGNEAVTPGSYENGDGSKEFLSTGRTGRRNALPDILGRHAETGLSDLPDRFEELSTDADHSNIQQDPNAPSTSKQRG